MLDLYVTNQVDARVNFRLRRLAKDSSIRMKKGELKGKVL